MSEALYYRPLSDGQQIGGCELKYILDKRFKLPCKLNYCADNEYIQGLADAKIEGAKELLEELEKYEDIELWKTS